MTTELAKGKKSLKSLVGYVFILVPFLFCLFTFSSGVDRRQDFACISSTGGRRSSPYISSKGWLSVMKVFSVALRLDNGSIIKQSPVSIVYHNTVSFPLSQ